MKNKVSDNISDHEKLPVWVVEDDIKTGEIISKGLTNKGYACKSFNSGESFIEFLTGMSQVDNNAIILLDFLLEDTDAITILKKIKDQGFRNPFVIMTAYGDEKTAVELMKLGAMDYIVKEKMFINKIINIIDQVSEKIVIQKKLKRSEEELKLNAEKLKILNKKINLQKIAIENEKNKADKLLQNILPKKIADELLEKGYTKPRQYEYVSILFADVIGFSDLTKKSHPIELVSRLDYYFYAFDEIIEQYGLEKIKTIGDCYMCAGGIPEEHPNNAVLTVLAGLKIQETANKLMKELGPELPAFRLRLGIHTGQVVAGVVGKNKIVYDIWGDAVNVAARIVDAGVKDKVNISENTYQLVKDYFHFNKRGEIKTKRNFCIKMYFVEKLKDIFSVDDAGIIPSKLLLKDLNIKQNIKYY